MKNLYIVLFLVVFFGPLGIRADAAIYSRKDAKGNVHITDNAAVGDGYSILLTTAKRPQGFREPVVTGSEFDLFIRRAVLQSGLAEALIRAVIPIPHKPTTIWPSFMNVSVVWMRL